MVQPLSQLTAENEELRRIDCRAIDELKIRLHTITSLTRLGDKKGKNVTADKVARFLNRVYFISG
jgi:hypothetical protein